MKKTYIAPSTIVARIEAGRLMAASDPVLTIGDGDTQTQEARPDFGGDTPDLWADDEE